MTMANTDHLPTCPHYFPGYPYDFVVLANRGRRMCGACYVELCNQSNAADVAAVRESPLMEPEIVTVFLDQRNAPAPARRRCPICWQTYDADEPHYEDCPGADAPGIGLAYP